MKVMKMIRLFETLFSKTMRSYWYGARRTGRTAGINEVKALIHAEIKILEKARDDRDAKQRILELCFILAQIKKL
jgi:hypothetical protein